MKNSILIVLAGAKIKALINNHFSNGKYLSKKEERFLIQIFSSKKIFIIRANMPNALKKSNMI